MTLSDIDIAYEGVGFAWLPMLGPLRKKYGGKSEVVVYSCFRYTRVIAMMTRLSLEKQTKQLT